MRLTGTFLDEISTDIPHQNWGYSEWDRDFAAMKHIGIKRVIMIRCGLGRWLTYPSAVLKQHMNAYMPPVDLVDMFLELAEKHGLEFYFGTYVSSMDWYFTHLGWDALRCNVAKEQELERRVIDEVWARYGHRKAFKGWYLAKEIATRVQPVVDLFASLGRYCKEVSGQLPVLISPGMLGRKAFEPGSPEACGIDVEEHERQWKAIMADIAGAVDIVAFQDGHVEYEELPMLLARNKAIAEANGMTSWTNTESFDRDMPIRFLPIKWEKMRLKLEMAASCGVDEAITFEFSHFMSPYSSYPQARGLYKRYCEFCGISYAELGID